MRADRLMGTASIVLGLAVAVSAMLGPLAFNVIRQHISANVENQVIGADAVSLALVAPLAIVAGMLWWRGQRLGPVMALGPAMYSAYVFFQYIVGSEYLLYAGNSEGFFPLFYLVLLLGLIVSLMAWSRLDAAKLPMPGAGVRRAMAGVLLVLGGFLGLAWSKWVYDIAQGARPVDYQEHPAPSAQPLFMVVMYTGAIGLAVLTGKLRRSYLRHAATSGTGAAMLADGAEPAAALATTDRASARSTPGYLPGS